MTGTIAFPPPAPGGAGTDVSARLSRQSPGRERHRCGTSRVRRASRPTRARWSSVGEQRKWPDPAIPSAFWRQHTRLASTSRGKTSRGSCCNLQPGLHSASGKVRLATGPLSMVIADCPASPGATLTRWRGRKRWRNASPFIPAISTAAVDSETVSPQPGGFYGGWITPELVGPFKGEPGTSQW